MLGTLGTLSIVSLIYFFQRELNIMNLQQGLKEFFLRLLLKNYCGRLEDCLPVFLLWGWGYPFDSFLRVYCFKHGIVITHY